MFGNHGRARWSRGSTKEDGYEEELVDRFAAMGKINGGYGMTYDDEPFEEIAASTPGTHHGAASGRAREFVFEATDGSTAKQPRGTLLQR